MDTGTITLLLFAFTILPFVLGLPLVFGLSFTAIVFGFFFWDPACVSLLATKA